MLELFESFIMGTTAEEEAKKKLEIMGNYSFYVEPSIVGFQGYHTSTVVISVFQDPSKKKALEFDVKWSKILNNEPFDMENYTEKHYHFTPSDIDLKIRATITTKDPKYPGACYLYVGPIELDNTLNPELEGMVLNLKGSFKVQIIARNGNALRPNQSVVRIDKPYLTINFDPILEEQSLGNSDVAAYLPVEINFETDIHLKVRIDNYSTTVVTIAHKDDSGRELKLAIQFPTREQRDVFYIFLRLLRSIKTVFLERLLGEYDIVVNAPWSFLHLDLDDEEDDPEGKLSFFEILKTDTIREHLRSILRMKYELSHDNLMLTDSLVVLEADLIECTKQFRSLLADGKAGTKSLAKYEKSRQALGELSLSILDDLKKGDRLGKASPGKKEEDSLSKEELEDKLKATKEMNSKLKKEIESLKLMATQEPKGESPNLMVDYFESEI